METYTVGSGEMSDLPLCICILLSFYFFHNFILFIYVCLCGSSLLRGLFSTCSARASH